MLIRNAEVWGLGLADVQIERGLITAVLPYHHPRETGGEDERDGNERAIDAMGAALFPGLHDHHIHLAALAARAGSVPCGPPEVTTPEQLAAALARPGSGWLRGIGYHESVMGLPSARELDRLVPDRPLRIQHRSGRMWLLNSPALAELLAKADPPPGLERDADTFTGRLFDEDAWLRGVLGSSPPDLAATSAELASYGVTGVTDMSPANDPTMASHFQRQITHGALRQRCHLAGTLSLADAPGGDWRLGPAKLHLHETALPDFHEATRFVTVAHGQGRAVAVHCVTEVELVFTLALFEEAGVQRSDRIEHASIASAELVGRIAALGLQVCAQPHFVEERGDRYLIDVETRHLPDLYRLRSLADAGIALAGGSDAPFGSADPWAAMRAATGRTTRGGQIVGACEALTPEEALALYLADPVDLPRQRRIAVGEPADLCLLDRPWVEARRRLTASDVRATFVSGHVVYDRVDQAPV